VVVSLLTEHFSKTRWWDFGADAYIVRLSFLVDTDLIIFRTYSEHKQTHPSDEELSITDGNTLCFLYLHHFIQVSQGWLWSRLALPVTNFVIEIEFKVRKRPFFQVP